MISNKGSAEQIVSVVVSSLVIIHVFNVYKVDTSDELTEDLFTCLSLPSNKTACKALMEEIGKSDKKYLE